MATNFIEAFQDGLRAAEAADRAKEEIAGVLRDLDQQIRTQTKGRLSIVNASFERPRGKFETVVDTLSGEDRPRHFSAIAAINPNVGEKSKRRLAKWSQDSAGYPCKITIDNDVIYCEDKASLESALAEMLRNPSVAETLSRVMNMEPDAAGDDANSPCDD